jgi:hypothetical protein
MKREYRSRVAWTVGLFFLFITGCATVAAENSEPVDLAIGSQWSGEFPVARLDLLPDGQRQSRAGYIDDPELFAAVWQAFKPGEDTPAVDFGGNLVVFSRNVDFYNRTNILKVTLTGGGVEIIAMETMSAMPIEDRVAMALAVIPRNGVKFIRAGDARIPVTGAR